MNHPLLGRSLERAAEIRNAPDVDSLVAMGYDDNLAGPAAEYDATHKELVLAEEEAKKQGGEALAALQRIDQPYSVARSLSRMYMPDITLPTALGTLRTETDKKNAIQTLHDMLARRAESEEWARKVLEGEFGQLAPETVREINEWIVANAAVQKARKRRATAYGLAYEAFMDFKDLVRNAYGKSSREYRRLHVRNLERGTDVDDGADDGESSGGEIGEPSGA